MQSALKHLVLAAAVGSVAGCQSPYGYQSPYYGNAPVGTYPQFPGGPVYNTTPGPTYVPNGQPGMGSPTPLGAPTTQPPSTYDNGSGGIKFDNNNGDAAPFNSTPPAGGRGTVPDPQDDLKQDPSASKPDLTPTSSSSIRRDFQLQPQLEQVPEQDSTPVQPANTAEEDDPFAPPRKISSAAEMPTGAIEQVKYESPPKERNPYGRDTTHANPEWLRGVVDFDPQERTWQIVYAATPDPRDRNGGSLTLGNHRDLSRCRNGDIVVVFGGIDANQVDSRGKPIYALDKVQPLAN
ncbi:MAG: hypothetical protein JSS49_26925 [Planctomycetes bacterium]|nr:hypothetical protein [Planctomycetota bacterium]